MQAEQSTVQRCKALRIRQATAYKIILLQLYNHRLCTGRLTSTVTCKFEHWATAFYLATSGYQKTMLNVCAMQYAVSRGAGGSWGAGGKG